MRAPVTHRLDGSILLLPSVQGTPQSRAPGGSRRLGFEHGPERLRSVFRRDRALFVPHGRSDARRGAFPRSSGDRLDAVARVQCRLYGSLGATGRGHGTDNAVILGLLGERPETVDPRRVADVVRATYTDRTLLLGGRHRIDFNPGDRPAARRIGELPAHPIGLILSAVDADGSTSPARRTTQWGVASPTDAAASDPVVPDAADVPYPYWTASDLMAICDRTGLSIARVALENERAMRPEAEIRAGLAEIWAVMQECVRNGAETEGRLPGGLRVPRRAPTLHAKPRRRRQHRPAAWAGLDHVLCARGQRGERFRGARRHRTHQRRGDRPGRPALLLALRARSRRQGCGDLPADAAAIGMIFKNTASISGAEVWVVRARWAQPAPWRPRA